MIVVTNFLLWAGTHKFFWQSFKAKGFSLFLASFIIIPSSAVAMSEYDEELAEELILLARQATQQGFLQKAEKAFRKSIVLNPDNSRSRHLFSNLLYRMGRPQEALVQIQKAAEIDPLAPIFQTTTGEILLTLGRTQEALPLYDRAIEIAPDQSPGYQMRADYYWGIGKLDKAIEGYRHAWKLDPANLVIVPGFGHLYSQLGDQSQAYCWAKRGIEAGPKQFYTNYVMAIVQLYAGNSEIAIAHLRTSLEDKATLNPLSLSLAILRDHELKRGQPASALRLYEDYYPALFDDELPKITLSNNFAAIGLAFILQRLDRQQEASKLLDASLDYVAGIPRQGWSGNVIADVLIHTLQGNKQLALAALREAIAAGWRNQWGYELDFDLILTPLRHEPGFQLMREQVKSELAEQMISVKAAEKKGDVCTA